MSISSVQRFVACILAVCLPTATLCADVRTGIANISGQVVINGKVVTGAQAVFDGDQLETADHSTALITVNGAVVRMSERTGLKFGESIRVLAGTVQIDTQKPLKATFHGLSISATPSGKFTVGETDERYVIAAIRGSLLISDGERSTVVPQGQAITAPVGQDAQAEPAVGGNNGKSARNGEQESDKNPDARASAKAGMSGLPGWAQVAIIGGAIGGTLGGLAAAGVFAKNDKTVSPSHP